MTAIAPEYAAYFKARLVLLHAVPGTLQAYIRAVSSPAAEAEHADLIVIGKAHAPGLQSRVLLGGTTTRVIRGANCSALTVPL